MFNPKAINIVSARVFPRQKKLVAGLVEYRFGFGAPSRGCVYTWYSDRAAHVDEQLRTGS